MAGKPQPAQVVNCGGWGLPPEYCEFGPYFEKCEPWLIEDPPDLYPDLLKEAEAKEADKVTSQLQSTSIPDVALDLSLRLGLPTPQYPQLNTLEFNGQWVTTPLQLDQPHQSPANSESSVNQPRGTEISSNTSSQLSQFRKLVRKVNYNIECTSDTQVKMPRRYFSLLEVRPNMGGWTVLLQVVESGNALYSRGASPTKYKRFIFTDSQGIRVSAVIYGNDIRYFAALLRPFQRYYISNAIVHEQDPKYRVSEYEYSWIINNSTLVEEHEDPNPPALPCAFQLAKFSELYKVANTEKLLNVQGVVIHVLPPRKQAPDSITRDIVIINEEKKPMLLTLWNEFVENEGNMLAKSLGNGDILIAMRVKVSIFNYLCLTTKIATSLLINPPIPEANHLRDWYNTNEGEVKQLIDQVAYKDSNKLLPVPEEENIISIEQALATLRNVKTAWIKGKPRLIAGQQRFWYAACMKCQKSIHADIEWTITCPACKEETQVETRGCIAIVLDDGTGSMKTVILGIDAEKLIPYTGHELKEADDQEISLATELAASIEKHTILCFVRHYDIETRAGLKDSRYTVVKAYIAEEFMDILPATTNKDPVELLPQATSSSKPIVTQQLSSLATQTKAPFAAESSLSKRRRHPISN